MLGFLQRNLKFTSRKTKELGYFALVRPHLEYCSSVWDPENKNLITKLEKIQRRAAALLPTSTADTHLLLAYSNSLVGELWQIGDELTDLSCSTKAKLISGC
jgi:hypothetical protein